MRIHGLSITAAPLLLAVPALAQFGIPAPCTTFSATTGLSACASESTAWKTALMHDLEYAKQLLQYALQVQQYADMVKNTLHGGPNTLTNIAADLNGLANVVQGGKALAWSLANQDEVFARTYPGYLGFVPPGRPGLPPGGSYAARYRLWAQSSLDTTQGVLRGIGMHGSVINTEMGVLNVLRALSSSNLLNRNDAINLNSQLASEQVAQLQKLRALQMSQITAEAAFQGYQIQRDADSLDAINRFFSVGNLASDHRTFPVIP